MDTKQLQSRISKALGSSSIHIQNTAITTLVGQVKAYVDQIKEDERIISEISSYKNQISVLRNNSEKDKANLDAKADLREAEKVLSDARELDRNMDRKKETIRSLKRDVEALHRELQSI